MDRSNNRQLIIVLIVSSLAFGAYSFFTQQKENQRAAERAHAAQQAAAHTKSAAHGTGGASGAGERPRVTPAQRIAQRRTATIRTPLFVATLSNLNAAITSYTLLGDKYQVHHQPMNLVTTDQERYQPMRLELGGVTVPDDAVWELEQVSPTVARFTWAGDGVRVVRKFEAGTGPYQVWMTTSIQNERNYPRHVRASLTTHHYVPREAESGGMFSARSPLVGSAVCNAGDKIHRADHKKAAEAQRYGAPVAFAAVENVFFVSAIASDEPNAEACRFVAVPKPDADNPAGTLFEAKLIYPSTDIAPHATRTYRSLAYMGPKDSRALFRAGHSLADTVDLNFAIIARPLIAILAFLHQHVGNWGFAIILLTILAKLVLFPLTYQSFLSMARMRKLKPEFDRINELYGEDREKKGAATMELYRKHKINPLGGCLPTLLQLPVWWALYSSLQTNVELYHASFGLWLTDLSAPDPYKILPLALGALMFVQQKITPTTMDPAQTKMMLYVMPITFVLFMLFLPAGLCLYMLTNSALGIVQQKAIERFSASQNAPAAPADAAKNATPPPSKT